MSSDINWVPITLCLQVNYLDLSGSRAFSLLLCVLRVFSWFLDEGEWFIHDWCVVHMGGQRAGGAWCWTPGGRGARRPVKHRRCWRWCCSLGRSTTAPAQRTLSPETWEIIRKCYISLTEFIFDRSQFKRELSLETRVQLFDKPFLQSKASLVAALAFHWISRWDSRSVICHVSVSVFAPEVRLTWKTSNSSADLE